MSLEFGVVHKESEMLALATLVSSKCVHARANQFGSSNVNDLKGLIRNIVRPIHALELLPHGYARARARVMRLL